VAAGLSGSLRIEPKRGSPIPKSSRDGCPVLGTSGDTRHVAPFFLESASTIEAAALTGERGLQVATTPVSRVLGRAVGQATERARKLATEQVEWPATSGIEDRDAFAPNIAAGRWRRLKQMADKRLEAAEGALSLAESGRTTLLEIDRLLAQDAELPSGGMGPSAAVDDSEFREKFEGRLRAKGLSAAQIREAVERARSVSANSVHRGVSHLTDELWQRNDDYAKAAITSLVASYFASAVAGLNTADTSRPRTSAAVDAWLRATQRGLAELEREILDSLRQGDAVAALVAAEKTRQRAENTLGQGAAVAAGLAKRRRQGTEAAARGAAQAVQVGDAMREILRALALSGLLRYHASGGTLSDSFLKSVEGRTLGRSSRSLSGASVGAVLRRNPRSGSEQTVIGTVKEITIVHKDRKAYSSATLVDADANEVAVAIPKMKLDSGGLAVGGAARARGKWANDLRWVEGGKGVLLGFEQDTRLANTSWRSWVNVQLRPVFNVIAHGLALEPSWEPGSSGAGNPLRYHVWSGIAEGGLRLPKLAEPPTQ
jgi:hypothetical protein